MILAITMVDECNKDETGVGPSIAIGNQKLNKNKEDLPKTAKIKIKNLKK